MDEQLSPGKDDQGRTNPTPVQIPQAGPVDVEELLRAADAEVSGASQAEIPPDAAKTLGESIFQSKLEARRRFNEQKQKKRRQDAKTGKFSGTKYQFKKAWFLRRANVPPGVLQEALAKNKDVARYQSLLKKSYRERQQEVGQTILQRDLPPLEAELKKLFGQMEEVFAELMKFDHKIRDVIDEIEFTKWWAKHVTPMGDGEIKSKLAAEIKRVSMRKAHEVLARQQLQIRKLRGGNWGKYGKMPITKGE